MARVNIVTRTTAKGPAKQMCLGGFMIEEIVKGKAQRYEKFLYRDSITAQELTLQLLANALTMLKRSENDYESITIFTDVPMVNSAFKNKWFEKWHDQEWINSKGEIVANADTWKLLWKLMYPLADRYTITDSYSMWGGQLLTHCELELKKIKNADMVDENVKKIKEKLDGITDD